MVEQHHVDHDLYADDTQLADRPSIACVSDAIANIENCITSINKWCASKRLQLNLTKSEIIQFETTTSLRRLQGLDLGLPVGADIITPVDVVHDLGVLLDTMLTMKKHISKITSVCFYHLRRLNQIRRSVRSRCYSQTGFCICTQPARLLQFRPGRPSTVDDRSSAEVRNAAANLIMSLGSRDHITPSLRQLHWLPVKFRVAYKLGLLMHSVHVGRCPGYIADVVTQAYYLPGRDRLRSAGGNRFELPAIHHKFGERAFSHSGPAAWRN